MLQIENAFKVLFCSLPDKGKNVALRSEPSAAARKLNETEDIFESCLRIGPSCSGTERWAGFAEKKELTRVLKGKRIMKLR